MSREKTVLLFLEKVRDADLICVWNQTTFEGKLFSSNCYESVYSCFLTDGNWKESNHRVMFFMHPQNEKKEKDLSQKNRGDSSSNCTLVWKERSGLTFVLVNSVEDFENLSDAVALRIFNDDFLFEEKACWITLSEEDHEVAVAIWSRFVFFSLLIFNIACV